MFRNAVGQFVLLLSLSLSLSCSLWAADVFWIDVRSAEEFAAEHVSPAVNIPHTEIAARIAEVTQDKDALIYLYCRSGRRSGLALSALQKAGYTNAVNLGGLQDAQHTAVRLERCRAGQTTDC